MDGTKYTSVKKRKVHPKNRGSYILKIFFCWFVPFLRNGLRKEKEEDDLYEIEDSQVAAMLGDRLETEWKKELKKRNPSLTKALVKSFGGELVLLGLFHLITEFVKTLQPILIFYMLSLFQEDNSPENKTKILTYASAIVFMSFVKILCVHNYQLDLIFLGMKTRVAVCSLIYRKTLKLSKSALAGTTIGQMVNLLSNDVGRFDNVIPFLNYVWCSPLLTVTVGYLLYIYVGPSGIVGTFFLVAIIPIQMLMAKLTSKYRLRTAIRTDERIRLMNEIISGIQVIKMYTWEKPFSKLTEVIRRKEIDQIRATSTIRALMKSCGDILNRVAVYLCILTYILTGNTLSATYTYTVLSFYGIIKLSVSTCVPQALTQLAEAAISVKRIQGYLLSDESPKEAIIDMPLTNGVKTTHLTKTADTEDIGIRIENMSVAWSKSLNENTLSNINFSVSSNQLVAVVGPVGGGKTTLLNAILRELAPIEGSVELRGTVSYASQEPWVFGGSVRQNILFGQDYEPKRYEEVIRVCALRSDFARFSHGDRTLVGERGVTLSGGQRARINLARAVYKEADIYLLDDPLSAVDVHVGQQLFDECIRGYLRNKCVVLVTHQLQYLENADYIYLLEHGRVQSSGTIEELKNSDGDFTKLLGESKDTDTKEEVPVESKVDHVEKTEDEQEPMILQKEQKASGKIPWYVYRSYFRAGGGWCKAVAVLLAFIVAQTLSSMIDYYISIWVNLEQWRDQHSHETLLLKDNSSVGTTSVTTATKTIFFMSGSWLNSVFTTNTSIVIYSCLVVLTATMTFSSQISFFRSCMKASTRLHDSMFNKIVYSTMRFFNTNPSGRILNRFSKDIGIVDEALPVSLVDTISYGLTMLATTLVIGSLNPWILIPSLIVLVIFYFMKEAFLVSSRNIKRIEAMTRSPLFTHLAASLQGLTTIRAFGAEEILSKEFNSFQDTYTSANVMFMSANRGFGFWLDLLCCIYFLLVMISILFIQNDSFGGNVGLSLTQAVNLISQFQYLLRQWSEFENHTTSVERVQEYADMVPERDTFTKDPPKSWPEQGNIEFRDIHVKYSENSPYVLKDLCFEIRPMEKIGIVGRTGAGKSSLIQALLRLTDYEGSIFIDGVDTKTVPLKALRSNISIIPQEPVLFSGTLRMNLDPFGEYNDEILWNALEEVELKNAVNELPDGLDSEITEDGSNFSIGQRQLVCLARAIVRNNKILVLDEATANVDPRTDALIQSTIRQKFANCTVLTIAHRLHTIMDSDRVLVLDAGQAVEFDHPLVLLRMGDGVFRRLVEQTGVSMTQSLYAIAEKNVSRSPKITQ